MAKSVFDNNEPLKKKSSTNLFDFNSPTNNSNVSSIASPVQGTFQSRFNEGIVPGDISNNIRASNQKWYDLLGSAALNLGAEVSLGTLEAGSYLTDLKQWKDVIEGTEQEYTNWFADIMKQAKESIKDNISPVYSTEQDKGFSPTSGAWWAENFPSIGSALSFLIPTLGAVKLTGAVAKGLAGQKLISKLSKQATSTMKGVTGAGISRMMEGTIEANNTFETTYQQALEAGKSEEQARMIAGEAASKNYTDNLGLLAFDMFQYGRIFKGVDNVANTARKSSSILKELGVQGFSEGTEEVLQYISSKEREREALNKASVINDKRKFGERLLDYSTDGDLWTSFFFGALGGAAFSGVGEVSQRKNRIEQRLKADIINPNIEKANAVYNNDELKESLLGDEEFVKLTYQNAVNGTLYKAKDNFNDWYQKLNELPEEQLLANNNLTKEQLQEIKQEKDLQFVEAERIFNEVSNQRLDERIVPIKFMQELGKSILQQKKAKYNTNLETTLAGIAQEKNLSPELVEAKKAQILRDVYREQNNQDVAEIYNTTYNNLIEQAKKLDTTLNNEKIKTLLSSTLNDKLYKDASNYINSDEELSYINNNLQRISTPEGVQDFLKIQENEIAKKNDKDYLDLIEDINPDMLMSSLLNKEKIANKLGKQEEFKSIKEKLFSIIENNASPVDFSNLLSSLKKRYENNQLLRDKEIDELIKRLKAVGLDEELIEQKYNSTPLNAKIITDFYNEKEANKKSVIPTPDFIPSDNIVVVNEELNDPYLEQDVDRNAFFTLGEQFAFIKTSPGKFITEYKDGNPVPSTRNDSGVNWLEINKPDFGVSNETVYFEYDFDSKYNKSKEANNNTREILAVIYKDNNILNKAINNRIVIGTVPAFYEDRNYNSSEQATQLRKLREEINNSIKNNPVKTGVFNTNITSIIEDKLPGRVWNTSVSNFPHQVTDKVLLAISKEVNGNNILFAPNIDEQIRVNKNLLKNGGVYQLVRNGKGELTPIPLFVKKLKELPNEFQEAKNALESIKVGLSPRIEDFSNLIGFQNKNINIVNGVPQVYFQNNWVTLDENILGELIAQVDINKINRGTYNEEMSKKGIFVTNINPSIHFHSVKFALSEKWINQNNITEQGKLEKIPNIPPIKLGELPPLQRIEGVTPTIKFNTDNTSKFKEALPTYKKWDSKKELAWLQNNLPLVDVSVLNNLHEIYKKGAGEIWGVFKGASIHIWDNAGQGVAYHEAFHAVFNLYHTDFQRKKLYEEASSLSGISRTSEYELEEWMADRFADIVQQGEDANTFIGEIKKFFKNLYRLFRGMFSENIALDELYSGINEGFYKYKQFKLANNSWFNNNDIKNKLFIDPRKKEQYVRMINTQFFLTLDKLKEQEQYKDLTDIELVNSYGITNIYFEIFNSFIDFYNSPDNSVEAKTELANDKGTGILQNFFVIENGQVKEFGEYYINAISNLSNFGINATLERAVERIDNPSDIKEFEIVEDEDNYNGWQTKVASISGKETLSYEVKKLLRMTVMKNENGEFIKDSIFNKPLFINFDSLYNYLERNLSDIYSEDQMFNKLEELSSYKPEIGFILDKLKLNESLRTQFVVNFTKTHIKFVSVQKVVNSIPSPEGNIESTYYRIFGSNRKDVRKLLTSELISNTLNIQRNRILNEDLSINKEEVKKYQSIINSIEQEVLKTYKIDDKVLGKLSSALYDLGIDLTIEELSKEVKEKEVYILGKKKIKKSVESFKEIITNINTILGAASKGVNPFNTVTQEYTAIDSLTNIKIRNNSDLIQSAFRNVENKNVYSNQNPNFLSKLITKLRDQSYINNIYLKDNYYKENRFIKDITDNRILKDEINYVYLDGYIDENGEGTKYTKMSLKQFEVTNINMFVNNLNKLAYYRLPILADSPILSYISFNKYTKSEILEELYNIAVQETNRIKQATLESTEENPIKNYSTNKKYNFLTVLNDLEFDINDKEATKKIISDWLQGKFEQELLELKRIGVISQLNNLGNNVSDNIRKTYKSDIDLVEDYFYNQFFSNINIFQLLHGDPSFYKESDLNAGKRNNQVTKPGVKLNINSINSTYRTIYLKDIEINGKESYFGNNIKDILTSLGVSNKKINNILDKYKNINTTDAQALITLDRWKQIQTGLGRWNNKLEKTYKRLKEGKGNQSDLQMVLKPFHYGLYNLNGKVVPIQNKNSEAVLLPQMYNSKNSSPSLKALVKYMEDNSIDSVQFVSAVKVGEYGAGDIKEITTDKFSPVIHELENDNYVIQQEVPVHHTDTDNLHGSQIRKLMLNDLDKSKKYLGGLNSKQIVKLYNSLIAANLNESYREISNEFENTSKLSKLIKREILDRKMGVNFQELTETVKDEKGNNVFKYPLYFPTLSRKTESLLSSLFNNNVLKQKINGASFPLVSNFAYSDDLKIVFDKESKSIKYLEVYMPFWSKEYIPLDNEGNIDKSKIDPTLLSGLFSYRIPTEDMYSAAVLKIKDFIPMEFNGIILPSEITTISGEDFDIDKRFIMIPNSKKIGNKIVKIGYDLQQLMINPENASKEERDNALIDITNSIWSSSSSFESIVTPGGFDILKDIRSEFGIYNRNESIALPIQQRTIFSRTMSGAQLIGIFANHNTSHAVSQYFNLSLNEPIKFNGKKFRKINKVLDTNKEKISRNIAVLLAAAVDNSKDPIFSDLNVNEFTANTLAVILRTGYDLRTALAFLNQKAIVEVIFEQENNDNVRDLTTALDTIKSKYELKYKELTGNEYTNNGETIQLYTEKLTDNIVFNNENVNFIESQLDVLYNYEIYNKLGNQLFTYTSLTKADTRGLGKDLATSFFNRQKLEKELNTTKPSIRGFNNVFKDTADYNMINSFQENTVNKPIDEHLSKLFPYNNPFYLRTIERIGGNIDLNESNINRIYEDAYKFFLSSFFNEQEKTDIVFELPKRLSAYKLENRNKFDLFQIISTLKIEQPSRDIPYERIEFNNNISLTNEQKDYLVDSWEYMSRYGNEQEQKLANDLIKYTFFTAGYSFTPNSFSHLVPISVLSEMRNTSGKSYLDYAWNIMNLSLSEDNVGTFVDQFIRNNWKDLNIKQVSYNRENISEFKTTKKNNVTSILVDSNNVKNDNLIFGYTEEGIPMYTPYIKMYYKGNQRLYKFTGYSEEITNAGVYNLISNLGIKNFANEYNIEGVSTIFKENEIANIPQEYLFNTIVEIQNNSPERFENITQNIEEVSAFLESQGITPADTQDEIIKQFMKYCKS